MEISDQLARALTRSRRERKDFPGPNPADQLARAEDWARRLTHGRPARNLTKALLALIEADEKPGPVVAEQEKPFVHGARKVLQKRASKADQPELPW